MRPGFSVHKVGFLNALQVFVLLQVPAHLHMLWIGLEVGVSRLCSLVGPLQLEMKGAQTERKRLLK